MTRAARLGVVALALALAGSARLVATEDAAADPAAAAIAVLRSDASSARRGRAARDLADLGPAARPALLALADPATERDPRNRALAIGLLSSDAAPEAAAARRSAATEDPAWEVREAAVRAIAAALGTPSPEDVAALVAAASDTIYVVRRAAAAGLARRGSDPAAAEALARLRGDIDRDVARAVLRATLPAGAADVLVRAETSPGAVARQTLAAAIVLGAGDAWRAPAERLAAAGTDPAIRLLAAERLSRLGVAPSDASIESAIDAIGAGSRDAWLPAKRLLARAPERAAAAARRRLLAAGRPDDATPDDALRSLAGAVASSLRSSAIGELASLLRDPAFVRRPARLAVRAALAELPGGIGLPALREELAGETEPAERLRLVEAFALRADDELAATVLEPALRDDGRNVRLAALLRLVASGRLDLLASAAAILDGSPGDDAARRFLRELPRLAPDAPAETIAPFLAHASAEVREEALAALGALRLGPAGDGAVRAACEAALRDPAPGPRLAALNLFAIRWPAEAEPVLARVALAPGVASERVLAVRRLGALATESAAESLVRLALDSALETDVRHAALVALAEAPGALAAGAIRAAMAKPEDRSVAILAATKIHAKALADALLAVARDRAAPVFDRADATEALAAVPAEALDLEVFRPLLADAEAEGEAEKGSDGSIVASAAARALGSRGDPRAWELLAPLVDVVRVADAAAEDSAGPDRADLLFAIARLPRPEPIERLLSLFDAAVGEPGGDDFRTVLGALRAAPDEPLARRLAERSALPPGHRERVSPPVSALEALARERRREAFDATAWVALERITRTFPPASEAHRRAASELAREAIRDGDAAGAARWLAVEQKAGEASGAFADEEDPFDARFPSLATPAGARLFAAIATGDEATIRAEAAAAIDATADDRIGLVLAARALLDAGTAFVPFSADAARRALDLDPLDSDALQAAADAALALGKSDEAERHLETLVFAPGSVGADASRCADWALLLLARGDRQGALGALRESALRDWRVVAALRSSPAFAGRISDAELDALVAPYRR